MPQDRKFKLRCQSAAIPAIWPSSFSINSVLVKIKNRLVSLLSPMLEVAQ